MWFVRLPAVVNLKVKEKYHLGTKLENEPEVEKGSCECGGKFTTVDEYAVKSFPPLLELRWLWVGNPDISTFGDCDIPRTIHWGEMEYDFVAAILSHPGQWSTRVFYQDKLYSGQSTIQDSGPWLLPVQETGWDTTKVAWKMTPKTLDKSFPVRLLFARRPGKNTGRDHNVPEGNWFRLDEEPSSASDGVEKELEASDLPTKPSESIPSKNEPCQTPSPPTPVDEIIVSERPERHGRTRSPRQPILESPAARETTKSGILGDADRSSPDLPKFHAINVKASAGTPARGRASFQPIPATPTPTKSPPRSRVEDGDEIVVAPLRSFKDRTPQSSSRPRQPSKGKRPAPEPEVEWVMDVSSPTKRRRGNRPKTQKEPSRSPRK